eukprot:TRINITY_DN43_c0_g1_i1.p1 TRINITY_DN43_c0_g1~~TRINITY_DN43_c0_g1_i1.p1  ORF type:complete len:347 (-),score=59.08 TRINITY_DN43_c0_g1_i1:59-1099(-)
MAKLGETDPRWIVSERSDGTNVNNWHWTEKNMMGWTKQAITRLFEGLTLITVGAESVSVTKVDHVKGEANINTRKGKVFHFYELDIKLSWKGKFQGEDVEGTITLPEVSFELTPDEVEIEISVTKGKKDYELKSALRAQKYAPVRRQIALYLEELVEQKGDLKSQTEAVPLVQSKPDATAKEVSQVKSIDKEMFDVAPILQTTTTTTSTSISVKSIDFKSRFRASTDDVFDALTNVGKVQAYTQSSASVDLKPGGKFSMFSNNITGEYVEVVPGEKLVMKWRNSSWPSDHYSRVTLKLERDEDKNTILALNQTGIPSSDLDRTQLAWREQMFERIKVMFGYGGLAL